MSQSRLPYKNEVDLAVYIKKPNYFYFPVTDQALGQPLDVLLTLENIKLVNNGVRTFCLGTEKCHRILVITKEGDILGEIADQYTMSAVANYRYFSYEHNKPFYKHIAPVKKNEAKQKNPVKKPKRKLTIKTTTTTQSTQKFFSNKIVSHSTPRPAIVTETKAPAPVAQETKLVPTDIAAEDKKITSKDLFEELRVAILEVNQQVDSYNAKKNKSDLQKLQSCIKVAAHLVQESYDATLTELRLTAMGDLNLITLNSISCLVSRRQQIVQAGKKLVPQAIHSAQQDLQFSSSQNGAEEEIYVLNARLKILTDWLERVKKDPFYATPPQSHAAPMAHYPSFPAGTLTSTSLTTPTTAPPPSIASPLSTASSLSPCSATLFSPPPQSPPAQHNPPLPVPPEGENEEVENGPTMTETADEAAQLAIVDSYLSY